MDHRVIERAPSSDGFCFHHALLREAMAASLPPGQRRHWHRSWAEVREEDLVHEADPWLATVAAAHHWVASGDVERGFDACVHAVEAAVTFHTPSERAPLLAQVLRLWDRVPDAASRSGRSRDELAMETIRATHFAGDWEGALDLLDVELRHPDSDRDPVRRPPWSCLARARSSSSVAPRPSQTSRRESRSSRRSSRRARMARGWRTAV